MRGRKNLTVLTGATAQKIVLTGLKVTGLQFHHHNRVALAGCRREVILCSGAIGTPQLLQLSGIGAPELLQSNGIAVRHNLPGVGQNLQDHLQIRTIYKVKNVRTLNDFAHKLTGKIQIGLEYLLNRSGPMSMAPSQLGAFCLLYTSDAADDP